MDSKIVKKMNEVIGFIKLVEREVSARASSEDRKKLLLDRKVQLDSKMEELDELMATTLSDGATINYHRQIKEEIDKLMDPTRKA